MISFSRGISERLHLFLRAVLQCFQQGLLIQQLFARQVSHGAGHPEDAVMGVILSLGIALLLIFFIGDPFKGLLISQMILSIQLPFTVFLQVGLTSSRKVMGQYVNSKWSTFVLYAIAAVVTVLNIMLLVSELTS